MSSIIADKFDEFLKSIRNNNEKINNYNYQIFYDLFKIRDSLWRHKIEFKREKDYTISEIFQDIIAKYISLKIGKEYEIILEKYFNKMQPDILIKKENKYISAIEIKTTIGYNRNLIKNNEYKKRIKDIENIFQIKNNKIFYVFESCSNVTKDFKNIYESDNKNEIKQFIFPLYKEVAHPFAIHKDIKQKDRKYSYKETSENDIINYFNIINLNNFDKIISKIIN